MTALMAAQFASQAVGAFAGHSIAKSEAKMKLQAQEHANTMRALSAAQEQDALSRERISLRDASTRVAQQQAIASLQDKGSAAVSAAAAGAGGGSVDQVMRQIERTALNANSNRLLSLENADNAIAQQRQNIEIRRVSGEDISVIAKPSIASTLLGLGTSMVKTYDSHQPAGERTTDALASLFSS